MTNFILPLVLLALLSAGTGDWRPVLATWACGQIAGVLSLRLRLTERVPGPFWQLATILGPQLVCSGVYGVVVGTLPVSLLTCLTLILVPPISLLGFCKLMDATTTLEHLLLSTVGPAVLAIPPPSMDCWICGRPDGNEAFEQALERRCARRAHTSDAPVTINLSGGWSCLACDYRPPEEAPDAEGVFPNPPRQCPKCGACRGCARPPES